MIRVGIVDDYKIMHTGLRLFFGMHDDLCVVAEGGNEHEAMEIVRHALLLVTKSESSRQQLDETCIEGGNVVGLAAAQESAIYMHLLIDPGGTSVAQIRL